tara:strand:- start:1743 stop:2225 length:483 start_codon:yes stop_codon:yes gene_type:complete
MMMVSKKNTLKLLLLFSAFVLSAAYFIEYILGHQPCNLCIIERIPYLASIILITSIFIIKKYEKIILIIILLFFLFGSATSFYHFGIEQGFFSESLVCDLGKGSNILSANDLLLELEKKTISCKLVTFRVFGLSLATFNTVISLILSVIIMKLLIKYEKN